MIVANRARYSREPSLEVDLRVGVSAYEFLGVFTRHEAREWLVGMEQTISAMRTDDLRAPPETRARAEQLIHELSAEYRTRPVSPGTDMRLRCILQALRSVGALSAHDAPLLPAELASDAQIPQLASKEPAATESAAGEPYGTERAPPSIDAAELCRVIQGPPHRRSGLRLSSMELYNDCIIVRWHLQIDSRQISDAALDIPSLGLADDVGTDYISRSKLRTVSMPARGVTDVGMSAIFGADVFVPPVRPEATQIRATYADALFDLSL